MEKIIRYKPFGQRLAQLRVDAGLLQQADLAAAMSTSQQTISRWEQGLTRPTAKQVHTLATLLGASVNELLVLAGHLPSEIPVVSHLQPFPVWALTPEGFEIFICDFLSARYAGTSAKVHQIGSRGHKQDGTDIEVILEDGSNESYQCKRHSVFGPDKVTKAVLAHTWKATKKYIVLARPASPQARLEIKKHAAWDIWDVQDISREIRKLSKEEQRRLVDTYFRGQRLALLGEVERGPWQTTEEFFAAFMSGRGAFGHAWKLVGRELDVKALVSGLSDSAVHIAFLVGAAGGGKSRVLKEALEVYQRNHLDVLVRFVSPTEEVNNEDLENLGSGEKIIVVDDAHDSRDDLQLLLQYVAVPAHKAKLLLSLRPYGLDYIRTQASNYSLLGKHVSTVTLEALTSQQVEELATQVLTANDGPLGAAKDIAQWTLDCPLATVIGAQIVAREKIHVQLAKNEESFRRTLLGRFQDIIAGDIGHKSDSEPTKKLLKVLAILQPFHPENESILRTIEQVEGVTRPEASRLMRLLTDANVLFKRGGKYRLSPDLLADYIIEQACLGPSGMSTGYAEKVFDATDESHIEHLLVNLGRLDWCRTKDPTNSSLLDGIWKKLKPSREYSDPHVAAVSAVAYYQPGPALDFAENLIREGKYLQEVPTIVRHAAYNLEHLQRACECLWELGKSDDRILGKTPSHAIRVLSELCAVEPNKPSNYNETVVEYGLSLLGKEDSWKYQYTPLDFLKGILKTEGHTTRSTRMTLYFQPFFVETKFVSALRNKVIDATIDLLTHADVRRAQLAARFLQGSLRYPMGTFGAVAPAGSREAWTKEFIGTLEKIERVAMTGNLAPLVSIEVVRSTSWHADYSKELTAPIARRLKALLPKSLEFRTTLGLIDGYGAILSGGDIDERDKQHKDFVATLTRDLLAEFPDGRKLRTYLDHQLTGIRSDYVGESPSPSVLYSALIEASMGLAEATVEDALQHQESVTAKFAGMALSRLFREKHTDALTVARKFLESERSDLQAAIGQAYSYLDLKNGVYSDDDLPLVRAVLSSQDESVVWSALGTIRNVAPNSPRFAVDLILQIDIGISAQIADNTLVFLQNEELLPFQILAEEDVKHLLSKLMRLSALEGHWIETFLSKVSIHHASLLASFFMARVEWAAEKEDWKYRPCNHGPYINVPLRFRDSGEFEDIFGQVWNWASSKVSDNPTFRYRAGELFEAMFRPFDAQLLNTLNGRLAFCTLSEMELMCQILREAQPSFVFEFRDFVIQFLEKAKEYGPDTHELATDALWGAAISGGKSGTPGQPFPEDLMIKESSEKALTEIPRFSAAYKLYEMLKAHADQGINWSMREREAIEE